jgi:hypothetical protein
VELLEKLQLKSLAALSAASGTSADSDSDASTVKNVPLKMNSPGQRKWKVQNMQFHKDLDSAKHVSNNNNKNSEGNNNNNNNNMIKIRCCFDQCLHGLYNGKKMQLPEYQHDQEKM